MGHTKESRSREMEQYGKARNILLRLLVLVLVIGVSSAIFGAAIWYKPAIMEFKKRFLMGSPVKMHVTTEKYKFAHAAVAADNGQCSEVGSDILAKGGSAVDSAISVLLCLGVINSHSTGIGGGGFMLVYQKSTGKSEVIDFRESAPAAATEDMFHGDPENGISGGLSVGVPGELKGMEVAWKKYGKLPWKELFKPAIRIAKRGFIIPETLSIAINQWSSYVEKDKGLRDLFTFNGKVLQTGDLLKRPVLARTLKMIAKAGSSKPFYDGELSQTIVDEINAQGGVFTLDDLRNYKVKIRRALKSNFGNDTLITCPPPTSGPVLAYILNILKGYRLKESDLKKHPVRTYHRIIEAFKFAYAKRTLLGDPDYEPSVNKVVHELMDTKNADTIRHKITDKTHTAAYYGGQFSFRLTTGTTHMVVLDSIGNAVSVTDTVNGYLGAKFRSNKLGLIYNNEMDDFSAPGMVNEFGFKPSPTNFIRPGKRPQSSSAPSMLVDKKGQVKLVLGGSGGSIITTSVANTLINYMWFHKDIKDAITMPRIHHQLFPEFTFAESRFSGDTIKGLIQLGHKVNISDTSHAVVQGISTLPQRVSLVQDIKGGESRKGDVGEPVPTLMAESDFRKGGLPSGF